MLLSPNWTHINTRTSWLTATDTQHAPFVLRAALLWPLNLEPPADDN